MSEFDPPRYLNVEALEMMGGEFVGTIVDAGKR